MSLRTDKDFRELAARAGLTTPFKVESPGIVWMAVHGAICLGLRHPAYIGPSRELVVNFVQALGESLIENGVLTPEELAEVQRVERRESPHR
jgi:hypothetical protein